MNVVFILLGSVVGGVVAGMGLVYWAVIHASDSTPDGRGSLF